MHDIVVVSDLHLGRGKNPETGRYYSLEAFFYDDDFARFCRWLCAEAERTRTPFKLVMNGDVFDLLRIEPEPEAADNRLGPVDAPRRERRFGATLTPEHAARTVAHILRGHPGCVDGIAAVLAAGHGVVFLPGNHDVELQWAPVQEAVRAAVLDRVRDQAGEEAAVRARSLLRFEPWFHHEPGRIWIEHGSQYDPECSFRYPLRGGLASAHPGGAPQLGLEVVDEAEQDFPLGNFFQRYLYNGFGAITFIVPSSRANARYVKWLLMNQPRTLFRVLWSHLPFLFQVLRRLLSLDPGTKKALARTHAAELTELATTSGLGEKLLAVDALKNPNALPAVVRALSRQTLVATLTTLAVLVLGVGLWSAGFSAIQQAGGGLAVKALLALVLNLFFLVGALALALYFLLRQPRPEAKPLRRAAGRIAELLGVKVVAFGHTHDEAVWPLGSGPSRAWYFNTGTWISVFTHDALIPRERVQFTFLRVRGTEGELLQWSPGRGEAVPVILLDEDQGHRGDDARAK